MITAGYIQRFQSTGTSELLDYIFLGAIIPLEAEGCLAPCYLPSRSSPCHSSPCIIGGRGWQWAPPHPVSPGWLLAAQDGTGRLRRKNCKRFPGRTGLPPASPPIPSPKAYSRT